MSYTVMYKSAQKLETVISVEESKLRKWQFLSEVITEAKDGLYHFYMERSNSLEPVLTLIARAVKDVEDIKRSAADKEELADIDQWIKELRIFRQSVYAYSIEVDDGYAGGSSAHEMEEAALDAANKMILLNRSTAAKIKARISENNKSILTITSVSRKILGSILIVSVLSTILIALFMNRALAKPLNILVEATRKIARGDLTEEITVDSDDEIGELSASFNSMIEELRSQKKKLVQQKDYVDSIIANMAESLAVLTPEGQIRTVNKATCDLLGYEEEELVGQDVNILFSEDDDEDFLQMGNDEGHSDDSDFNNYEINYRTSLGESIPVLFSNSALRDKSGDITGIVCVAQDITQIRNAKNELRSYAEQLTASNKELRHFLHIASHDLQEPFRKVSVFGDRLKEKYSEALDEKGRDYIERMQRATDRMQTLINDLLAFSRLTTKAQPFAAVSLSEIARDVVDDLKENIEQAEGRIEITELPVLDADATQMHQLFQNIIENALKFKKDDTHPKIRISGNLIDNSDDSNGKNGSGNKLCQMMFEDNGIGFDPKYSDRIFGVFQRLHGKNAYTGTGMGLSICHKIVERHGGKIEATGALGEGAKIIVTLPISHGI